MPESRRGDRLRGGRLLVRIKCRKRVGLGKGPQAVEMIQINFRIESYPSSYPPENERVRSRGPVEKVQYLGSSQTPAKHPNNYLFWPCGGHWKTVNISYNSKFFQSYILTEVD